MRFLLFKQKKKSSTSINLFFFLLFLGISVFLEKNFFFVFSNKQQKMSTPSTKGYAALIAPPLTLQSKRQLLGSLILISVIANVSVAIASFLGFTVNTAFTYTIAFSVLESFLWVVWLAICLGIEESAFFFFAFAFAIINIILEIIQFAWRVWLLAGESFTDIPIVFQLISSWGILIVNFFIIFFNLIIFMYVMQIKVLIIAYFEDVMSRVNELTSRAGDQEIRTVVRSEKIPSAPPMSEPESENEEYFTTTERKVRRRR